MATYTSKNGHLGATDEVSGGYSHEITCPSNAKIRNAELKLVLVDCLKMIKRIAELEQAIMSNCYDDPSTSSKRLMALATQQTEVK